MELNVKIKKLAPDLILPRYALSGDVGLDLFAREDYTLAPAEHHNFGLGFALEFPIGYGAFIKDKGSFGRDAIHALGGVFDAGYRGEYNVELINLSQVPFSIVRGQKIAQLVIFPVAIATFEETDTLSDSERQGGKHGSTGKF